MKTVEKDAAYTDQDLDLVMLLSGLLGRTHLKAGHTNHLTPKEANDESKAVRKENKVSGDSGQT